MFNKEKIRFVRVLDDNDDASIEALIKLEAEQFDYHCNIYPKDRRRPSDKEIRKEMLRDFILTDKGGIVKAIYEHEVIGFCSYKIETGSMWDSHYGERVMHIEDLFVSAPYRRKGVGTAFFTYMKELASLLSVQSIELQCASDNASARSFYEKCNMKEIREKVLMRCALT